MLSVVIVAWNEEKNLPRAVSSVRKIADEIVVVVDEASTDDTATIAKKLKAKVFTHPHTGIVEPMRNYSIAKAQGDWILLLDADEEITSELANFIRKAVSGGKADYYRVPRKNLIFGEWIKSEHWWPDYVYRLFRKGRITWEDTVHSIPFTKGKGEDVPAKEDLAIVHHNYDSISQFIDRQNRYTDFQAKELINQGYSFAWSDVVTKPTSEFLRQYFARKGYTQGLHGLALALLMAFSEATLYLKLWQQSGFVPVEVRLGQLVALGKEQQHQTKWWLYQAKIDTAPWPVKLWWKLQRKLDH